MAHQLTIVWGTDAVNVLGEASLDELNDLGHVETKEFETEAEMHAYRQGVEDTEGWLEAVVFEGDSIDG